MCMRVSLVYMVSLFCEIKTQIFDGIYWCCMCIPTSHSLCSHGTNNLLAKKQAKIKCYVTQTNGIFCHASIFNTVHLQSSTFVSSVFCCTRVFTTCMLSLLFWKILWPITVVCVYKCIRSLMTFPHPVYILMWRERGREGENGVCMII